MNQRSPRRRRNFGKICYAVLLILLSFQAQAQTDALHLIGPGQLRVPAPLHVAPKIPTAATPAAIAPKSDLGNFVLRGILVDGSSASAASLRWAATPAIGHEVNSADISLIAQRIGIAETKAGIALYTISIPIQKIQSGVLHFQVTEGTVVRVEIAGTRKGARLGLIQAYAEKILASRPLRQKVLERNILLMGDIAGTKIGSKFIADPQHPGAMTLLLAVQQKKFFGGFGLNNQGAPLLGNTQAVFNAGVNDLFHEGERTQFVLGLPLDISRYQFYGINDIEPIGDDGLTLSLTAGKLVSHPVAHDAVSGTADFSSLELDYPVIHGVHRNVILGGGFDYLNSSNAFLGFTSSDERTRVLRISIAYNDDQYFNGINRINASVSQGLSILGARLASPVYGGPGFTKENLKVERLQVLPASFVLRLSVSAQATASRLPPSQEFEYGGADYGQAFYAAELAGDEGVAALAELSHTIPPAYLPNFLNGSSIFTSVDYGRVWNRQPVYVPATDRGASFAGGIRLMLQQKVQLQLAAALPLIMPQTIPGNQHWRFVVGTSGQF